MKKTFLLIFAQLFVAAFMILSSSSSASAQSIKIGYVQIDSVLKRMPAFKAAKSDLESYQKMISKDLQGKQQTLQTKYANYQKNAGDYSPIQKKQAEEELNKLGEEFQKAQAQAQQRIQKKEKDALFPIYDKIREAIKQVGAENGYTLIFNELDGTSSTYILYAAEGTNATELVIKKLGL